MKKKITFLAASLFALISIPTMLCAQTLEFRGVKNNMRYDDGETSKSTYVGYDEEQGKAIFTGDVGLWKIGLEDSKITPSLFYYDNLLYGNSGSVYVKGYVWTVFSHEKDDNSGEMEFIVRKWDAETGKKISEQAFPKSTNLESRGMSYNPIDGKVYGLFYITDADLPGSDDEIDPEDKQEGLTTDAGYAIGTIDLETMKITQITPGLYYDNFVTLACSPDGRLFAMTAGGTLTEFDRKTGLMLTKKVVDEEGNEEQVSIYEPSGVKSQFKRQAACFDYKTGKMYWNGFINNGMGVNEWGSVGPLSDKNWRENGKYDTALYEVDINTGKATMINKIPNRITFSCLWVVGNDASDIVDGIKTLEEPQTNEITVYNISGQLIYKGIENNAFLTKGLYIIKKGSTTKKVYIK